MKLRDRAMDKSGGKAGSKSMAAAAAAPKRIAATKRSAPTKKPMAKKAVAKKPALAKKPAPAAAKAAPRPVQAVPPRPLSPGPAARPSVAAAARPAAAPGTTDERRKAATRKFFARLRSLEAIVGADLRKRGSVVLMQAVDQWYKEAISATATDVSITTAAKAVITHL